MRLMIKKIDYNNKAFYCNVGGVLTGFYLTNRLAKIFLEYLGQNILVDFEASTVTKKINNHRAYQVLYFNEIYNVKSKKYHYNHLKLKHDMIEFLEDKDYYLFLDLEMTMSYYRQKNFKPEVVQYGYLLMNKNGNVILENGNYVIPVIQNPISKKTLDFISISQEIFYNQAIDYKIFYVELKNILEKYQPKIVVWGRNDIITLDLSYKIHNVKPLTTKLDFIDLLKLHKDYFNLRNDLGLFKAYKTYYDTNLEQEHDAVSDAKVTKKVFEAFVNYTSYELKEIKVK